MMRLLFRLTIFVSFIQFNGVYSFLLSRLPSKGSQVKVRFSSGSVLRVSTGGSGDNSGAKGGGPWKLSNDFNTFLNQCTIQSFIFLVNSLRDRHTALWLEDFTQPIIQTRTIDKNKNDDKVLSGMAKALQDNMPNQVEQEIKLLTYHGLGAVNTTLFPTWDSYFDKLLNEPAVTYLIESSRPHVPSYELEINPTSLCSRLISVREQIAREFTKDLDVIADMSEQMLDKYFDKLKGKETDANGNEKIDIGRANLLFLQIGVGPDYKPSSDYKPSALRSGNFDLLTLLVTQESIHRVLNEHATNSASAKSPDNISILFLRNFYTQRLGTHFVGSNWYGRADDFLEELLATPPSVVQLQDEECGLVDPIRVVQLILKMREKVALEWLEMALDAPQSHSGIKRRQLNKMMGIGPSVTESTFE